MSEERAKRIKDKEERANWIKSKLAAIEYCIFSDDTTLWDGPAWEDVACHLFDLLEVCRQNISRRVPEFESNEKFISYYSGVFSSDDEGRRRRLLVKKYAGTITPDEENELYSWTVK